MALQLCPSIWHSGDAPALRSDQENKPSSKQKRIPTARACWEEHADCEAGSADAPWILASYGVAESVSPQASFAGVFGAVWE